ncbi:Piwi-like protein 2 [Leptotrombidium deliense]|uniref:Piwi-like protein 2 n=1 Tax=Leptotrombidium deliense TaxID=299467 RepID=A0A443S3A2_9ACAR|nr:Piwi-like protein 2 [Leptotrombidium deliense]
MIANERSGGRNPHRLATTLANIKNSISVGESSSAETEKRSILVNPEALEEFIAIAVDSTPHHDSEQSNESFNYVELHRTTERTINEYIVTFQPEINDVKVKHSLLRSASVEAVIGTVFELFDQILFLPTQLDQKRYVIRTSHSHVDVNVSLKFFKQPLPSELIPLLKRLFRHVMQLLQKVKIKRQFYEDTEMDIRKLILETWPGLVSAVIPIYGGYHIQCNVSKNVLRINSVRNVLNNIMEQPEGKERFEQLATQRMKGCIVCTPYSGRLYEIENIRTDLSPMTEFLMLDGEKMTYVDYYKTDHNIDIQDRHQPMLITRNEMIGEPNIMIALIPELCYVIDAEDTSGSQREAAENFEMNHEIRKHKLFEYIRNVRNNEEAKKIFDDWGLKLSLDYYTCQRSSQEHIATYSVEKFTAVTEQSSVAT